MVAVPIIKGLSKVLAKNVSKPSEKGLSSLAESAKKMEPSELDHSKFLSQEGLPSLIYSKKTPFPATNPNFKEASAIRLGENPDELRMVMDPDLDTARETIAHSLNPDFGEIVDPVSKEIATKVQKQIYDNTQKALENFPEQIKVYRVARINEDILRRENPDRWGKIASFSLNPDFVGDSLRGSKGGIKGGGYRLREDNEIGEYIVNKKDILASVEATYGRPLFHAEQEVLINPFLAKKIKVKSAKDINKELEKLQKEVDEDILRRERGLKSLGEK